MSKEEQMQAKIDELESRLEKLEQICYKYGFEA